MSYLNSLAQGAGGAGGPMAPQPATQGLGPVPSQPGLPPPPTGVGKMPVGAPTTTKMSAGADAIAGLRSFAGFAPEMQAEIQDIIAKIKSASASKPGQSAGPAGDDPGVPGAAALDDSALLQSGSPGPM
jgi:hypothetical protein